jgi:hypothetical protein
VYSYHLSPAKSGKKQKAPGANREPIARVRPRHRGKSWSDANGRTLCAVTSVVQVCLVVVASISEGSDAATARDARPKQTGGAAGARVSCCERRDPRTRCGLLWTCDDTAMCCCASCGGYESRTEDQAVLAGRGEPDGNRRPVAVPCPSGQLLCRSGSQTAYHKGLPSQLLREPGQAALV